MFLPDPQADILKAYFKGLGIFDDLMSYSMDAPWTVFTASLPDDPDNIVTFCDCKGVSFGRTHRGQTVEHYGVDVYIRSLEYRDGHRLGHTIQEAADAITGVGGAVIWLAENVYQIKSIYRPNGALTYMGEEPKKRREMFSLSFRTVIKFRGTVDGISYSSTGDRISSKETNHSTNRLDFGQVAYT